MKFVSDRPLADPEAAARKLMEIAKGVEPVQDVDPDCSERSDCCIEAI